MPQHLPPVEPGRPLSAMTGSTMDMNSESSGGSLHGRPFSMRASTWILYGAMIGTVMHAIFHVGVQTMFTPYSVIWLPRIWIPLTVLTGFTCRRMFWRSRADASRILAVSFGAVILILLGLFLIPPIDPRPSPFPWYSDFAHILWVFMKGFWLPFWLGALLVEITFRSTKIG